MPTPIFLNAVSSTVQAGSSAIGSATATGVNVATGDGAKFGTIGSNQYVPCVILDTSTSPETVREYVWATVRASDALTVVRQAESSSRFPASTTTIQAGYTIAAVASAAPLQSVESLLPLNVKDFGAVGDGTTDDSAAINAAIAALPAAGGKVYFPAGSYAIGSTINLGNGSSSALSTQQGIYLEGAAGPIVAGMADLTNTGYGGVQLKWIGAAGATMMSVNGPLVGWGIRNICLSGNSLAYTGLKVISAQGGEVVNFAVKGLSNSGTVSGRYIWEFTVPAFGGHLTNTMHNSWRNIFLAIPATTTFQNNGWVFDAADSSANTCYESVQNLSIVLGAPSSGCQVKGITFGGCDNIRIRDLHVALVSGGAGQAYPLLFNYSNAGSAGWPADCLIDGVDFGNGFTAVASSFGAPSGGATPNRIVAISSMNGSISDPALPNLHWGYTASNP